MTSKTLLILFVCGIGLIQVTAQIDELETVIDDEITTEDGSAERLRDIISDDEDMDDSSGEGMPSSWNHNPNYDPDVGLETDVFPTDDNNEDNGIEVIDDPDVDIELQEKEPTKDKPAEEESFIGSSQFFAAIIIGGSVGLLFAICVILLLLYRMRKKDEGSYIVDDEKKHKNYPYTQGQEYYA